jgi:hypothetical protein
MTGSPSIIHSASAIPRGELIRFGNRLTARLLTFQNPAGMASAFVSFLFESACVLVLKGFVIPHLTSQNQRRMNTGTVRPTGPLGNLPSPRMVAAWPTFSSEVTMPYATGETPEIGDYIKNEWEQPGTVTRVHLAQDEEERICIRWVDGGLELLFSPASEYTLVSRRST